MWLKQGTEVDINVGIVVFKTALPVEDPILRANIMISKNGAPKAVKNDTSNSVYDDGGDHIVTVNSVDTNELGSFRISVFDDSGEIMLGSWEQRMVVPAAIYDYFILGIGSLSTNLISIVGTALAADANGFMANNFSTLLKNDDANTTAIIDLLNNLTTLITRLGVPEDLDTGADLASNTKDIYDKVDDIETGEVILAEAQQNYDVVNAGVKEVVGDATGQNIIDLIELGLTHLYGDQDIVKETIAIDDRNSIVKLLHPATEAVIGQYSVRVKDGDVKTTEIRLLPLE